MGWRGRDCGRAGLGRLGGEVPALTAERVQAMSQVELEQAIKGLRAQASELERAA